MYFGQAEAMQNVSLLDAEGFGLIINADGDGTSTVLPPASVCAMSVVQFVKVMLKSAEGRGSSLLSLVQEELVPLVNKHMESGDKNWVLVICKHGRNRYLVIFWGCLLFVIFLVVNMVLLDLLLLR